MTSIESVCPKCGDRKFALRFLKDEGVGTAKCINCSADYLLLDSEDYWFDVIQNGFPRLCRCSCGSTAFTVLIDYVNRDDGDVRGIKVSTSCSECRKTIKRLKLDIDYSPTRQLIEEPLVACANPKLLYDVRSFSLYVKPADIARTVAWFGDVGACSFEVICWEDGQWISKSLNVDEVRARVLAESSSLVAPSPFRLIYATADTTTLKAIPHCSAKDERVFWQSSEVVRIKSPIHMNFSNQRALLYYIEFSNEYVLDGEIQGKSKSFRQLTANLVEWLKAEFVSWRGSSCFDNPEENIRIFGERFRARPRKR